MTLDAPTPLATPEQMAQGQFADLVRNYTPTDLAQIMVEATRACEGYCLRRLAPFTDMIETHRTEGIDPDEDAAWSGMPLDNAGALGLSYSQALGGGTQVRHMWLNEYAPIQPELWSYSDVSVEILRSYGGSQVLTTATQIIGPEVDSGHVWFQLGLFIPVGSLARVTYSGGYRVAIPAGLVRACKVMAASLILQEIDPVNANDAKDPGELEALAERLLHPYVRS